MEEGKVIDERAARLERLEKIKAAGLNPYPAKVERTIGVRDFLINFEKLKEAEYQLAGRVKIIRRHGGLTFLKIADEGGEVQVLLQKNFLGDTNYEFLLETLDVGDFLWVKGSPFLTKTQEKTIKAKEARIIAKALLPLPEKWHGLTDTETRYRKRYLDLIANPQVKNNFILRSQMIRALREFFDQKGFLEVETPILHPTPGGALAKPFITHHNALDVDLYLRIAPELYLKRLIVGGFEKVYEIARCFRNEGIDPQHNPEFTQIEFYQAYANYEDLMKLTEEMLVYLLEKLNLGKKISYLGQEIDFTPPYKRLSFRQALIDYAHLDIEDFKERDDLFLKAKEIGCEIAENASYGKILDEIYKTFVRPQIWQPVFIIDHPVELSPLAKKKEENPRYVERFQLVLARGIELCNAYSELNDPLDQRARFEEQEKARALGEEETQRMDEDFLTALEHGMPPTAGFGMGIDRLAAILTNSANIKEIIFFPTLRPESK